MNTTMKWGFTVDGLLFDLDGTLIDRSGSIQQNIDWWAALHGLDGEQVYQASHGRRFEETVRMVAPHLDAEKEALVMSARESTNLDGVLPIAGAHEILALLGNSPWAIITSARRRVAEAALRATGLPIPKVMVCADDVQQGKPDPEGVLRALMGLRLEPAQCVLIGDAPTDIEAARRAKVRSIGIGTTFPAGQLQTELILPALMDLKVEVVPNGIWLRGQ